MSLCTFHRCGHQLSLRDPDRQRDCGNWLGYLLISDHSCDLFRHGLTTSECPTTSGTTLTIKGSDFASGGFVEVGGLNCQPMNFTNSSYITCVLPAGVGLELPVVASSGIFLSLPAFSVSYARPVISSVSGCPISVGSSTSACDRAGTSTLTITGNNFGSAEPTVYLGRLLFAF